MQVAMGSTAALGSLRSVKYYVLVSAFGDLAVELSVA